MVVSNSPTKSSQLLAGDLRAAQLYSLVPFTPFFGVLSNEHTQTDAKYINSTSGLISFKNKHKTCRFVSQTSMAPKLGPPVVPFYPFLGEGSRAKVDYRKTNRVPTYSNLSTGGPSIVAQDFHLCKNTSSFVLLVLKGIDYYWKYVHFSQGRKSKWKLCSN